MPDKVIIILILHAVWFHAILRTGICKAVYVNDLPGFSFVLLSPPRKQGFIVELGDLQKVSGPAFGRMGDSAELEGNGTTRSSPRLALRSRRSSASLQLVP